MGPPGLFISGRTSLKEESSAGFWLTLLSQTGIIPVDACLKFKNREVY